jgi:hypothetical protein
LDAEHYARGHADRGNLLIHLLAVPLFIAAAFLLAAALVQARWLAAAGWLAGIGLSLALQAIGHQRERLPPEPFSGPLDFLARILAEQFYRFPRLLLSGRWLRNLWG